MDQIRQGEIWLRKVSDLPRGYESGPDSRRVLLAIGETGNAHTLVGQVRWLYNAVEDINSLNKRGARAATRPVFVEVSSPAVVEHSDRNGHQAAQVEPGVYRVTIKREQLPWAREASLVAD